METEKSRPNLNPSFVYKINVRLLPLYLDAGNLEKSMALLHEMDEDIADVADVPLLNGLAERLGDKFLAKNDLPSALTCYRQVRDNEQILTLQKQQIDRLHQARVANLATIVANLRDNPGNPLYFQSLQQENMDIDLEIAKDQDILKKYQTLPPVLPPLFLRVARAFSMTGSFWESAVLYREILRRYPHCAEAESALYGSIINFDHLTRIDRAEGLCQTYLTQYPKGRYADSIGFLRGALAYDARDYDKATEYFEDSLKKQPRSSHRRDSHFLDRTG